MPGSTINIPLSAWEQAAVVILFAILIIAVLYALGRLLKDQRTSQAASMQAVLKQQQEFIEKRDLQMLGALDSQAKQWQDYMREQRQIDQKGLVEMACNIKDLGKIIDALKFEFREHVVDEMARFDILLTDKQKEKVAAKKAND